MTNFRDIIANIWRTPEGRDHVLNELPPYKQALLVHMWEAKARKDQLPPDEDWAVWLQMGGRGAGKTRSGAEWVRGLVNSGVRRIALVAETYADAREVMIEGVSGLSQIGFASERPNFVSSRRRLEWPNGAVGHIFSAEDPDSLRGPQFEAAWADEFCAWTYPADTLANLRLATRLGTDPKILVTTTPRNIPALHNLINTPGTVVTRASTQDNAANLAPTFLQTINAAYGGTKLARQELGGELLTDTEGALWTRQGLEEARVKQHPPLERVIVAVDPPVSHHATSDACGIIVAGTIGEGSDKRAYVLEDGSVQGVPPKQWAQRAISLYHKYDAERVVVEINQGGDMVSDVIGNVDAGVPVVPVYASKSKRARAEPVAVFYQQGRVKHAGSFPKLEDELCVIGTQKLQNSPDRADALVWAITDLLLTRIVRPGIRTFNR